MSITQPAPPVIRVPGTPAAIPLGWQLAAGITRSIASVAGLITSTSPPGLAVLAATET